MTMCEELRNSNRLNNIALWGLQLHKVVSFERNLLLVHACGYFAREDFD
jgi:hypothetical protein